MTELFEAYLLNFFFILICLAVFLLIEKKKPSNQGVHKLVLFLLSSLAVVLCMIFPIRINDDFLLDLRLIPVIAGGLYGGWKVAIPLLLVNIGFRMLHGGSGVESTIFIATLFTIVLSLLSPFFLKQSLYRKVSIGILVGLAFAVFTTKIMIFIFGANISFNLLFIFFCVQSLGVGLIFFIREYTVEKKILFEKMIRTKKLEVVSQLASSFSHEVKNPLTTVRGFLQLLEQSNLDEQQKSFVKISIEEIDRTQSIIHDYLTISKPVPEVVDYIDGQAALERSIEIIRPIANGNCVIIEINVVPFTILGNPHKFQQCLLNLTKNAIEAMSEGGKLTVRTEIDQKQNQVWINIIDTGIGMNKEHLARLGEPYFSTKGTNGTGLGMLVVNRIVESMNGTITAYSKLGKGTHFVLRFPLISNKTKQLNKQTKDNLPTKDILEVG